MGIFSFLSGSRPKRQSASALPDTTSAKSDAEALLDALMPFAKQMLQQYHEFFPFGGQMAPDGKITNDGAYSGEEHPPSQALIEILRRAHHQSAHEHKLRACATIYDIRTIPPNRTEQQDAIAAAIDHVSGYSVVVIFPYTFDSQKKLQVEAPFVVKGSQNIFPQPSQTTL